MHRFQTWRDVLQAAKSRRTLNRVMIDYARSIPPAVRAALPDECRLALQEPIDVQEAAVTLVQAELSGVGRGTDHGPLHEVAHTFAAAAVRFRGLPDVTQPNPPVD